MSRLFYGSSNVYRNYTRSSLGLDLGLTLVQCTKKAVLDAHVASLSGQAPSLIITSVLENFIADVCLDIDEAEAGLFSNQLITAHVETMSALVAGSPDSVVCFVPLLCRLVPGLFFQFLGGKKERLMY